MNSWEQCRLMMYIMAQVNSKKHLELKDIITFPWDNIHTTTEISNEEIKNLKEKSKAVAEIIKQMK